MFLRYMNKGIQFVKTIDWVKEVKQWEVFETSDANARSWFRNYKWMFEEVETKGDTVKENEKKENKKKWNKIIKK